MSEAEDVVQDAYLRFERANRDEIRDARAWLTTVVGRRDEHREIVFAFGAAAMLGDFERLLELLDPDVVWRSDGGGKAWLRSCRSTVPRRSPRR